MNIRKTLDSIVEGERLSRDGAVAILRSNELSLLAEAADAVVRRLHPEEWRTYNIERNINYTNICVSGCRFCAFCRTENDPDAYVIEDDLLFEKIEETVAIGGNQILLQGGLHPNLPFSWYETLILKIKTKFPKINVHGFSPSEIVFFSDKFGMSIREVLERLRDAGLGSLPGGGAEILSDSVRNRLSPKKANADRWLEAAKTWHELGGIGTATMMFGHLETLEERVEHLQRIRDVQDETGGFTAFIPWTLQPGNTEFSERGKLGAWEYLKMVSVARLFLDNIPNIQASWVTQGLEIGTLSLKFGANDFGSVMIEENVVAAAGTVYRTNEAELRARIKSLGFQPRRRDVGYNLI